MTMLTAAVTANDFSKYTDDDYSYQSGENENQYSGSTLHTATMSKLEDYKFDSPYEAKKDVVRIKAKPVVPNGGGSSNAGSSGWSTSDEDTDSEADDHQDGPLNGSGGDSFFNPRAQSIKSKEKQGCESESTSKSASTSESEETYPPFFDENSTSSSESEETRPQFDSDSGSYLQSYADESMFSELYKCT